jgi:hypothetical protein
MFKRATIHDLLGDLVVYRSLEPMDGRLGGLSHIRSEMELKTDHIPRKTEPAYADVVLHILWQAQRLRCQKPLKRLIYIGDTQMNDGTAIANLRAHLPVWGFIASEKPQQPERVEITEGVMYANRWGALADFIEFLKEEGFLDKSTAAIIDLDKTAFGARGRNSDAIDAARVAAVKRTVKEALGSSFVEEFRVLYDELNQPHFHPFTADNQDYLIYICLMVAGGVWGFEELLDDLKSKRLRSFSDFIEVCNRRPIKPELIPIHQEVYVNFRQEDPTPFKSFRYREYEETVARMDALPDDTKLEKLLKEEIVLTGEVVDICRFLAGRGVLLFGLTDKPDEASIPQPKLAQKGYLPLHRVRMKVV